MYVAGIDIGSTYSKAIMIDDKRQVVGKAVRRTGFKLNQASEGVFQELLENCKLKPEEVTYVAATGYGRHTVMFRHTQVTELTAHAHAAVHLFPKTRTLLDIGGQDIKAVRVDGEGRVKAFRLNDKCAAGTGAFLEKTARYLGISRDDMGPLALKSQKPVEISSVCAVFAESEVISHLAQSIAAEDIMMGAMISLGSRAIQLMRRVGLEPEFMLTGGMVHNAAMIQALEGNLKAKFNIAPDGLGQLNGAMGAALLGLRRAEKLLAEGKPIPPTAANLGGEEKAAGETTTRRRWSAFTVEIKHPGKAFSKDKAAAEKPAAQPAGAVA